MPSGPVTLVRCAACAVALWLYVSGVRANDTSTQEYLRERIETLELGKKLRVDGVALSATALIPEVYAATQFQPAWTDAKKVDELLHAIEDMQLDGLDPQDYYLDQLKRLRAEAATGQDRTAALDLDLLLTDALARVVYHAHYGKVDPERVDESWNLEHEWKGKRGADAVFEFIRSPSLYARIEKVKPQRPMYNRLRKALADYRRYEAAGGWKTIPTGSTVELGKSDARIPAVRTRLTVTEDLPKELDNGDKTLDAPLQQALERFQKRHSLRVGKLDTATIRTMNQPPKVWIDQLRVNLERARWILPFEEQTYVMVNIAAFEIFLVKNGKRVWSNAAQVGRTFSKTPLFRDEIQYFVINPTWTVPPGVLAETVLPAAKKDPGYIRQRGLHVIDDAGHEVAPESVAWSKFDAKNLPYTLTQKPGDANALGVIKFMFPNKYHVYLHDTPNQLGYDARVRTMSWGCIHVKDPLELAAQLVNDGKWSLEALQAKVKAGKTETVYLNPPVPVFLLYWTADVTDDGVLEFRPDVYSRDRKVLSALKRAPKLRRENRRGEDAE